MAVDDGLGDITYFGADVLSFSDYYPFGMTMPNRNGGNYRFGFNGMEADDEVKGGGNSYTTEYRQLDVRIGRWLSIDPLFASFPHQSPYATFDNNPILLVDPKGLAASGGGEGEKKKTEDSKDKVQVSAAVTLKEFEIVAATLRDASESTSYGSEVDYELQPVMGFEEWAKKYGNPNQSWEHNRMLWEWDFRWWKVVNEVDPDMSHQEASELWYAKSGYQRYDVANEFGILYVTYAALKEPAEMYITNTMFIGALGLGVGAAWFAPGAIKAMQNLGKGVKDLTSGSGWMQFAINGGSSSASANIMYSNYAFAGAIGANSLEVNVRWIKHDIFNELKGYGLQGKFVSAMNKGFAQTRFGNNGIIRLTSNEILEHQGFIYPYKIKVLGQGTSHYRLYGRIDDNGALLFDVLKK